jgi:tripartite-type tricarboxylate transporter receptor subunit TctC
MMIATPSSIEEVRGMLARRMALVAALAGVAALQAPAARAQSWPTRTIRFVVTFPPGGASDIVARVLAEAMSPTLGQRVVVDNRPGAGGTIAAQHVATQPADGYTLILSNTAPYVTSPPLYANLGYDPMRSFTHISYVGAAPMVVVTNTGVPATDMPGLMAWLRAQSAPVSFGTSGTGSVGHVVGTLFSQQTGIALNHVPYRGSQPMQADLLGGSIPLSFDTLPENVENIRAGRLRAFAITAPARAPSVPDVPTVAEVGLPGLVALNWMGVSAPAGLPAEIAARLHAEVAAALQTAAVRERLASVGVVPDSMSQEAFGAFVAGQIASIGGAVRAMGIRAD